MKFQGYSHLTSDICLFLSYKIDDDDVFSFFTNQKKKQKIIRR